MADKRDDGGYVYSPKQQFIGALATIFRDAGVDTTKHRMVLGVDGGEPDVFVSPEAAEEVIAKLQEAGITDETDEKPDGFLPKLPKNE